LFRRLIRPCIDTHLGAGTDCNEKSVLAQTPVLPTILFVSANWPAGVFVSVTVESFARIFPVHSGLEAVQRLTERPFGLVILDQSCNDGDMSALLSAAKARRCAVLVVPEPLAIPRAIERFDRRGLSRAPMLIQGLIEGAANGLAARLRWPPELPQLGRPVRQAIEEIRGNYRAPLTVRAIADAIHVSPSHLAHRFRLETGMTVKEYVTRMRVEMARRMLLETDSKLDSIASAVGFCDAPHLSRVFVQYTRQRPGEYRRRPPKQFSTRTAQDRPLNSV
jgi:AraC-like DNA-binding protein